MGVFVSPSVILAVLLMQQPSGFDKDEPTAAREERLGLYAQALSTLPDEQVAPVIAISIHESRLARYVSEACSDIPSGASRCDEDPKTKRPRALGYTQLWRAACKPAWEAVHGSLEQLQAIARCTGGRWAHYTKVCKTEALAFTGYARGYCVEPLRDASLRVKTLQRVRGFLAK